MGAKKYKETMLKEVDGLYPPSPPSNDDLILDLTIPTPPQSPAPEYQLVFILFYTVVLKYNNIMIFRERVENDNCEDIDEERNSNYCDCLHDHPPTVIMNVLYI